MKEFRALRSSLQEGTEDLTESQMLMPPNILILRRQTVRQYPGGLMVALYFNDKLKQYFSIPYGAPNVDSTITPTSLKEGVITEDPKLHQVGDEVRYRSGSESHLRAGKVVEVHPEHLMVHRKGAHGHYGYHYRVSKDHVVHNSRTGYTREELNEISIPVATRAFHARQELGDKAKKKKQYRAAIYHYAKATKTLDRRAEKYKRENQGDPVKEAWDKNSWPEGLSKIQPKVKRKPGAPDEALWPRSLVKKAKAAAAKEALKEDAISHLQKVKAFATDKPLYHKDGSQTRIDPTTAHALLSVHDALHPDNRKKFADALEHSKPKFHKMLDFAWKSVK